MSIFRRRSHRVPALNTSSLPDLVFTVLFFFMIVTHMRRVTLKVKYQTPQGTELTRLTKITVNTYMYLGSPIGSQVAANSRFKINDKLVTADEVTDYMAEERKRLSPEDLNQMSVTIKSDRNTRMKVITDVKKSLRKANTLRIYYAATDKKR
ncbi:MAG: biopolymer transporter ExbD [Bacteroidales bacterium]|nr:biopolymer transporter ExbD [Bacteroidales bacterium]